MTVWRRARKSTFGGIIAFGSLLLVACGGGGAAKGKPMVADPPSSTDLDPSAWSSEDAGATSTESEVGAASGGDEPEASSSEAPAASGAAVLQGDEDGARTLLAQFVAPNADHAALTRSLRPTTADYKSLFDADTASKIEAAQAKDWNSNKAVIKPKPAQTEVKVWGATGSDLANGTGNAKEFPGAYKKIGKHLAPSVLFFRFKFVEPGKETGTAYDGLAFVNGHWVIAPKPWRAIEGRAGGMEEEESAAPEKKTEKKSEKKSEKKPATKKKPKGKKR